MEVPSKGAAFSWSAVVKNSVAVPSERKAVGQEVPPTPLTHVTKSEAVVKKEPQSVEVEPPSSEVGSAVEGRAPVKVVGGSGKRVVVVDTAAVIKNVQLRPLGDVFYTVADVIAEIRDEEARRRLELLPVKLELREPSKDAVRRVAEFAHKTGDFAALSAPDIRVIAITLMLTEERGGTIRDKPITNAEVYVPPAEQSVEMEPRLASVPTVIPGWGTEEWAATDEDVEQIQGNVTSDDAVDVGGADVDANADAVFCLTSDFAMQNVLFQMGLRVLAPDGKSIQRIKQWALRCFGCFKVTRDMNKVFCPACGNNTLKRVSISVAADGSITAYINPKYKISTRGTRYVPPKPQGGRHAVKFITDETQLPKQPRGKKKGNEDYLFGDPRNRPAEKPKIEFGGRNPNERKKSGGKKKKNHAKGVN